MWDYTDKVKEYFFDPKNAGVLEEANAVGEVGAISCGDALKLMMSVDPETEVITSAKFQTFGCGSAIASSSALTELIIGKTITDALKLNNQDIADFLGGLPPEKMHCSVMGYEALQAAVANFRGEEWHDDHEEGELVCKCFGVDAGMIERAVKANKLTTPELVTFYTKAGGGCLTSFDAIEETLARVNADMVAEGMILAEQAYRIGSVDPRQLKNKAKPGAVRKPTIALEDVVAAKPVAASPMAPPVSPLAPVGGGGRLTMVQKIRLIEEGIAEMRPHLIKDGGNCELVDVDGSNVYVKLSGACTGCQLASMTISGMQQRLVEKLQMPLRIIPVS